MASQGAVKGKLMGMADTIFSDELINLHAAALLEHPAFVLVFNAYKSKHGPIAADEWLCQRALQDLEAKAQEVDDPSDFDLYGHIER